MSISSPEESVPPPVVTTPEQEPEGSPHRGTGSIGDTGAHQVGGWVTASPPKFFEVLQHVFAFPGLVARHRDLITTSVSRELRARFTGTLLGWAWPLVTPLLFFGIFYFIFTKLLSFKFGELPPEQEAAMGVYMFIGVLVWSAFGESVASCTGVFVDNGNLIKKVAFPSEILPLNQILVFVVTMLFGMVMFVVGTLVTPLFGVIIWEPPSPTAMLWILLLLPFQILFTYGLGLILGTLQVYLRDTLHVVAVGITVWMFATPIFWAPEMIPDSSLGGYRWVVETNPVYHLVYSWRSVLMSRQPNELHIGLADGTVDVRFLYGTPVEESIAIFGAWAVGIFLIGYTMFLLGRRRFADEV